MIARTCYPVPELGLCGCRQHALHGPAALDTVAQTWGIETYPLGPFRDGQRLPVVRQRTVVSPISLLLFPGRPSAVLNRVSRLIVDPVQRGAGRSFAHVCKEVIEGLPAITDSNPTSAVVDIVLETCIQTSGHHGSPGSVRRRTAQTKLRRNSQRSTHSGAGSALFGIGRLEQKLSAAFGARHRYARRILTGHRVTSGVSPGRCQSRRGTLRAAILPYTANADRLRREGIGDQP